MGKHLTAIAHAEREGIFSMKEGFQLLSRGRMEKQTLGPTLAGTEDVSIRETAACDEPME